MPEVELSIHGVVVKLSDNYGDLEEMSALALGLSEQIQEQWRKVNYSGGDSPVVAISADGEPDNDKTTDEVTT